MPQHCHDKSLSFQKRRRKPDVSLNLSFRRKKSYLTDCRVSSPVHVSANNTHRPMTEELCHISNSIRFIVVFRSQDRDFSHVNLPHNRLQLLLIPIVSVKVTDRNQIIRTEYVSQS